MTSLSTCQQILPDLVVAMERQGFTPAEVKGSYGFQPKEEDAEDNPLLVVGVHTKDMCRIRPGQKEPFVVPLTRLWDKLSRFSFPSAAEAAHRSPLVET